MGEIARHIPQRKRNIYVFPSIFYASGIYFKLATPYRILFLSSFFKYYTMTIFLPTGFRWLVFTLLPKRASCGHAIMRLTAQIPAISVVSDSPLLGGVSMPKNVDTNGSSRSNSVLEGITG